MTIAVTALALALVAAWLIVLGRLGRHLAALRRQVFVREAPSPPLPRVSVLVPARNEALAIERCLRSLLAQDYPALEVLVWDDGSDDDTLERARAIAATDPRLVVIAGDPPPPGWIAKCHALDRLAARATGEWLLFADADTVHACDSVGAGLAHARRHGALVLSCSGQGILGSFWEKAWEPLWPCFLFWWLHPDRVNDPRSGVAFAVGQWLLVSRAAYDRIGGHAAVRREIVEDCALMKRARELGIPGRVVLASPLFAVRMYRSLGAIREGWTKNIAPALTLWGGGPLAAPLGAAALALLTVVPFAVSALGLAGSIPGVPWLAAHGPAVLALAAALAVRVARSSNPHYFWTLPLAGTVASLILLDSWVRSRTGRPVRWKGRTYPGGIPGAP